MMCTVFLKFMCDFQAEGQVGCMYPGNVNLVFLRGKLHVFRNSAEHTIAKEAVSCMKKQKKKHSLMATKLSAIKTAFRLHKYPVSGVQICEGRR